MDALQGMHEHGPTVHRFRVTRLYQGRIVQTIVQVRHPEQAAAQTMARWHFTWDTIFLAVEPLQLEGQVQ